MSEFRRPNPEDTFIWPSSVWNEAFTAMLREVAAALGHALDIDDPAVVAGFEASADGLVTTVLPGFAVARESGRWSPVVSLGELEATHDAHQSQPRIDVVSLTWAIEDDTPHVLGRVGNAVPASTDTQAGVACEVVITKGTPDASPSAPSTPSGHIKLWEVEVPANSGALVFVDARRFPSGSRNRDHVRPIEWRRTRGSEAGSTQMLKVSDVTVPGWATSLLWDADEDWFVFNRNLTSRADSAERKGAYFPMMIPAGRTWWTAYALGAMGIVKYTLGDGDDLSVSQNGASVVFARQSADTAVLTYQCTLPVDVRSLEIVNVRLRGAVVVAWTGSASITVTVVHGLATTVLASYALPAGEGAFDLDASDFAGSFTPVVVTRGLYLSVSLNVSGGGAGNLRLDDVCVEFREGRTS